MVQREAIYKGATRPAMKFGIPLVPLVVLFGGGMLVIVWGGLLLSWWIAAGVVAAALPALAWMRFVTGFREGYVSRVVRAANLSAPRPASTLHQ